MSRVFISHIHEEGPLASALKRAVEAALPASEVFVSSEDIALGRQWLAELNAAMDAATAVFLLCSTRSRSAPWIQFEAGGGWGKDVPVVVICHTDMTVADLQHPLSAFDAVDLRTQAHLQRLISSVGGNLDQLEAAWKDVAGALEQIDYVPPSVDPLPAPHSERSVLLDLAHGQADWPQLRQGTVFSWRAGIPDELKGGLPFEIASIVRADQIRAVDMAPWRGALVAMPFHARIEESTIDQFAEWVRAGGRLALLGYELGDLHHEANLNDLAARFGLRFNGDIVAPSGWSTSSKPYGVDIGCTTSGDHPLLDQVGSIVWRNLQTIAREPGTRPVLGLDELKISIPSPESVGFARGRLTMPNPTFETVPGSAAATLVAQAVPHLTGKGAVVAIGTWDLLPEGPTGHDNSVFAANLLRWLSGTS